MQTIFSLKYDFKDFIFTCEYTNELLTLETILA